MIVRQSERVLVQGITGQQGTLWAKKMRDYGTTIIGGVNPWKAGTTHLDLPVWGSIAEATSEDSVDVSVLFVPPLDVKAAALDAIDAGIRKLIIVTKHVPVQDTMYVLAAAEDAEAQVLGPNTAGTITPGECFTGSMPAFDERVFKSGNIGVFARSGSLGALACANLVRAGFGIAAFIDIGSDPIVGTTAGDALRLLDQDERTEAIALVGEIGGTMEEDAADYAHNMTKPIVALIAGSALPPDRKPGCASAITLDHRGSYDAKKDALEQAGVAVLPTLSDLARELRGKL